MSCMIDVAARCSWEDYNVVQIDDCNLQSHERQYNVHDVAEIDGERSLTKQHSCK